MTALYAASMSGHDEVVRVLLAAKANVDTQTKVGFVVQTHFPHALTTGSRFLSGYDRIAIYGEWEVVN